jgi:hypothetical protein
LGRANVRVQDAEDLAAVRALCALAELSISTNELQENFLFWASEALASFCVALRSASRRELLRLGLRLRSVVTGVIPPLGHELVEFGPVLGKAQPMQEFLKLALFFFERTQCIGAIFVESAISA